MKTIQAPRSVITASCLSITPIANDVFLQEKIYELISGPQQRTALVVVLLLLFVGTLGLAQVGIWLYDNYLWKLIFRKNNLEGYWYFINSYETRAVPTKGFIRIEQDPFTIRMIDGRSAKDNPYSSRTESLSATFQTEDTLVMAYSVSRIADDHVRTISKRSVEELKIHRDSSGRPESMSTKFWNCLRDSGQQEEEHKFAVPWPIDVGQSLYIRISRTEFDNRVLTESSIAKL